jgi:very-short-patch-repair endonuclease
VLLQQHAKSMLMRMHLSDEERTFARYLRQQATDAETRIWYHLRARRLQGLRFRRQHPVAGYFADFACLELRLIVELDGGQHDLRRDYDVARTDVLVANGFEVLRFWNNDVLSNTQGVLATIVTQAAHIKRARAEALTRPDGRPLPAYWER